MNELGTGWKKDRYDPTARLYSAVTPKRKVAIPEHSGLAKYLWPVMSQGSMGACVGFSFAGQLTGLAIKLGIYTERFSPQFIWNGARYMEGTLTQNEGTYPSDAVQWILEKGGLLEHYWPFSPYKLDMRAPWSDLNQYAAKYPVLTATRVDNGSKGILEALANGHFVSMGTPWSYSWYTDAPLNGVLPYVDINGAWMTGGHATALYDYDLNNKVFLGINSWDTDWGNNGLFTMKMSEFDGPFKQLGGYDAFFLDVEWKEGNNPIPPQPSGCFVIQGLRKLFNGGN